MRSSLHLSRGGEVIQNHKNVPLGYGWYDHVSDSLSFLRFPFNHNQYIFPYHTTIVAEEGLVNSICKLQAALDWGVGQLTD